VSGGPVRAATPADVPTIARFIRELARYEQLEHQLDLDEERLRDHLFGQHPACGAIRQGFALWFQTYSTFRTRPCLHLEDLFVLPEFRGRGLGLALLRELAAVAVARDCPRLDWQVLDWNAPAIGFYEKQGARVLPDWRVCRLDGDALQKVAAAAR
jgi:GNAT superfamily N-acetyltransferase